jgi:predicted alpha/beta-fold hydrolase
MPCRMRSKTRLPDGLSVGRCLTRSDFRAPWWLKSAHLQTAYPTLFRRGPEIALRRERLELDDGDFLDLDWTPRAEGPVVLVLHGLEGSSDSPYARGMLSTLHAHGWRGVIMHFRGCSGEPNRLPRSYHSGDTGDLSTVVAHLRARRDVSALAAVGYSMGGNVLLKWLGERGAGATLDAAVAVSVPFTLSLAADRLARGLSRIYQRRLIDDLRAKLQRKFFRVECPIDLERANSSRSFWEFDDRVTAPLHGFADVHDYYAQSSSRQYLGGIGIPTLILHSEDDPFMTPEVLPSRDELSPSTRLEVSTRGGHVGFVQGSLPWRPHYWLEERIPEFLDSYLD